MAEPAASPFFSLRRARPDDERRIRGLIYRSRINPLGLNWRRFWVAVDLNGRFIGCGQVKPHWDGTRELASIAVEPAWRKQGVARAIIRHLLQENPPPLYLTCRAGLGEFYRQFGFVPLSRPEMPPYFRLIHTLVGVFARMEGLLVMRRDAN